MKKLTWLSLVLVLVLAVTAIASASVYGGVSERQRLREANRGGHQILGDQGGVFTISLNQTQEIYYLYDWDFNWYSLGRTLNGDNAVSWDGTGTGWNQYSFAWGAEKDLNK